MDKEIVVELAPERKVETVLNLTPHEIKVGERIFPASPPAARAVARNEPRARPDKTKQMGLPVIEAYDYTDFAGLPRKELEQPGCAVIVSQVAADWLAKLPQGEQNHYLKTGTSVYVPDTDKGALREGGRIVGTSRLIFCFETFHSSF